MATDAVTTKANTMTPELRAIAAALWEKILASYPDNPRNDVAPFATGVE